MNNKKTHFNQNDMNKIQEKEGWDLGEHRKWISNKYTKQLKNDVYT